MSKSSSQNLGFIGMVAFIGKDARSPPRLHSLEIACMDSRDEIFWQTTRDTDPSPHLPCSTPAPLDGRVAYAHNWTQEAYAAVTAIVHKSGIQCQTPRGLPMLRP
ncbi:MAG: hypothetical protein Q9217_004134 [Psora testacea]